MKERPIQTALLLGLLVVGALLFSSGCSSEPHEMAPSPPMPLPQRATVRVLLDLDGVIVPYNDGLLRSDVSNNKGTITGLGEYPLNGTASIAITAKSGYAFDGVYFRYSGSSYTETNFPTTATNRKMTPTFSFKVAGDITVLVRFKSQSSPGVDVGIDGDGDNGNNPPPPPPGVNVDLG